VIKRLKLLSFSAVSVLIALLMAGCIAVPENGQQGSASLSGSLARQFIAESRQNLDVIDGVLAEVDVMVGGQDETADMDFGDEAAVTAAVGKLQAVEQKLSPLLALESAAAQYHNDAVTTFVASEVRGAGMAKDVLGEYEDILVYLKELAKAVLPLENVGQTGDADVASSIASMGQTFSAVYESMKTIKTPSFLQYMHQGLMDAIQGSTDALGYISASVDISDPLRLDSGVYRFSVIEKQITALLDASQKDVDRRKDKLTDDTGRIRALAVGLRAWLDTHDALAAKAGDGPVAFEPLAAEFSADLEKVKVTCTYQAPDTIIPANYRSLDYIVYLSAWSDNGPADVLVTVEIPGFTQKYQQKLSLTRAETQVKIHPPLAEGASASLNSSKDAQLNVSVTDLGSNAIILEDTKPVKLYSRYDMQWEDANGTQYFENALAWVTPESPEVKDLLRQSADTISTITNGQITFIGGYQGVGSIANEDVVWAQAAAIMQTLAGTTGVKYVATPFSSSGVQMQRVATPAEVINKRSGLCIETAVTVASALQATNMHPMLIILPTHAQVALETWSGSGEYYIIETTALDDAAIGNFDNVIAYWNHDRWTEYMQQEGARMIDCDMARDLGIASID
jgi:hypothetical protein